MNIELYNQEIMVPLNSRFCGREFCRRDAKSLGLDRNNLHREQLENACWAGMLFEVLPELIARQSNDNKSFIWDIHSTEHFLLINRGRSPRQVDRAFSLNPYIFFNTVMAS